MQSYNALDPKGNKSPGWRQWILTLLFGGLAATVLLVYAGVAPECPWSAISKTNSLVAPRLYFYGIEFVVLGLLAYYIVFMWKHSYVEHVQFLQLYLGIAFVLDIITWALWGHSEFIGAAVTTGINMLLVIYTAKAFYYSGQSSDCSIKTKPNISVYAATSLPLSTYAGWLIFQFVLLVNAAFSKDNNGSFVGGSTTGPVALFLVVFSLAFVWVWNYHDFHVATIIWLALIPTLHASLDVQNAYTNVNFYLFGGFLGFAVYGLYERFTGRARRIYICDDVCIGEPVQG
ncbi:MAG: hypothetical protein CMP20_15750 [Rickettsiales bacterium]|nr:hypothetical protein [Rickettsiales bacterium]